MAKTAEKNVPESVVSATVNWEKAQALAVEYGLKPWSVVLLVWLLKLFIKSRA